LGRIAKYIDPLGIEQVGYNASTPQPQIQEALRC
jgi:hypothetical protein